LHHKCLDIFPLRDQSLRLTPVSQSQTQRSMSSLPFSPSCPLGGQFYVCDASTSRSKFVGCCTSDPCSETAFGCTAGALRPASFNASFYGTFADQECSAGLFYTCADTEPPFLGCCKSNPCQQGGCPRDDLAGAFLSGDPGVAGDYLGTGSRNSSDDPATGTNVKGQATEKTTSGHGIPTGEIVGLAVGIALVLLILVAAVFYVCSSKSEHKREPHRQRTLDSLHGQSPPVGVLLKKERKRQYSSYEGQLVARQHTEASDLLTLITAGSVQSPPPTHYSNSSTSSTVPSPGRQLSSTRKNYSSRGSSQHTVHEGRILAPLELDGLSTEVSELDSREILATPVAEDDIRSPRERRPRRRTLQAKGSGYDPSGSRGG
jgi:hypothetical protein